MARVSFLCFFVFACCNATDCASDGSNTLAADENATVVSFLQTEIGLAQLQMEIGLARAHRVDRKEWIPTTDLHHSDRSCDRDLRVPHSGLASRSCWFSMFQRNFALWQIASGAFAILAWCSLAREVLVLNRQDKQTRSREPLWDIAKFWLMCFVWMHHAWGLYGSMQLPWSGWFMPAFFFLAGLVASPLKVNGPYIRKFAVGVLRDTVFNVVLLALLMHVLRGGKYDWLLAWFLVALCTCRLGIPMCFHIASYLGDIAASILVVAVAFILPYALQKNNIDLALVDAHDSWRITTSWFFYAVGFVIDPDWLGAQLKIRVANCIVISAMAVILCVALWKGPMFVTEALLPEYMTSTSTLQIYARQTLTKLVCVWLFLAMWAPMACSGGLTSQVLSQLGQRTLHAYLISVFFYCLGPDGDLTSLLFTPTFGYSHLSLVMLILATSVACSPLAEWCFCYVTSPQWIFDVGSKVTSVLQRS